MEKTGLSKKQLILFISSIIILAVFLLLYFANYSQKNNQNTTAVNQQIIVPTGSYQLKRASPIDLGTLIQYTGKHFTVVYPATWKSYSYRLSDGTEVFLIKPGLKTDEVVPSFELDQRPETNAFNDKKDLDYSVLTNIYKFTHRAIPVDGDVVDEAFGVQNTKNASLHIFKHVAYFLKNGYEYNMSFTYTDTTVRDDYENIYGKVLELLRFTSNQ